MALIEGWDAVSRAREWLNNYIGSEFQTAHDSTRKKLAMQLKSEPSDRDIIWALFNSLVLTEIGKKDYFHLQAIYYQMALFLNATGRNSTQMLKLSNKMQLLFLQQQSPKAKVRIMGGDDSCESCKKIDGQVFTFEEALKQMPLPHPNCSFSLFNDKHSFCRCLYVVDY